MKRMSQTPLGLFFVAILLGTIVLAAPMVNSASGPPRSVFLVLPEGVAAPEVALRVKALGDGRFLVTIDADGFQFTDVCVSHAEAAPVGHAHVHVDGEKVASAYSPVVEIGPLAPGEHLIDVVLRGQDHRPIVAEAQLVRAASWISVPG